MPRLVEFPVQDGGSVVIEVDDDRAGAAAARSTGNITVLMTWRSHWTSRPG